MGWGLGWAQEIIVLHRVQILTRDGGNDFEEENELGKVMPGHVGGQYTQSDSPGAALVWCGC